LNSGDNFANRLRAGFKEGEQPQLVHVATDGESYGHHHKHGEMALAYTLRLIEADKTVNLANYGSYLAKFPPEFECEIVDNTSWSLRARDMSAGAQIAAATGANPDSTSFGESRCARPLTSCATPWPRSRRLMAASFSKTCGPRATLI